MRVLIVLHRWWGVAFCLLFVVWFASGIVMHFVPFPVGSDADRFSGWRPIDRDAIVHGPAEAVVASGVDQPRRVRLVGRRDGPIYLVSGSSAEKALRAADLGDGGVHSKQTALGVARDYATSRGLDASRAAADEVSYDQWTVAGDYDADRPLYLVSLNDGPGTELYVSSTTGDIVCVSTHHARVLNYLGSIAHWIYPTALRHQRHIWNLLMWWLSLIATIGVVFGVIIGLWRLNATSKGAVPSYRGAKAWHYYLGLACAPFVLAWAFSGWLSMDDGRLFPRDDLGASIQALAGSPDWRQLLNDELQRNSAGLTEIEWFAFGGRIYRRERATADAQHLTDVTAGAAEMSDHQAVLGATEIEAAARNLGAGCGNVFVVGADDPYRTAGVTAEEGAFRIVCGDTWFDIDGRTGALVARLVPSSRAFRWLFRGAHTLDFPPLNRLPWLRSTVIVALCVLGLVFSLSGVVIAWQRILKPDRF